MAGESVRDREIAPVELGPIFDPRLPAWMTPRTLFILLLLISMVVNLTFGFASKFRPLPAELDADELEYYQMATGLMTGALEMTARRTLAFPLLIAGIRSFTDSFLLLQALVTALYSFSVPLLFLIVRRVTRSLAAGALAGLALAFWPPVIFYGVSLYSETLALPVFLLALLALPPGPGTGAVDSRKAWPRILLAGFLLALATQVRPMYLLMTPFLAAILLAEEKNWRRGIRNVVLAALAFTVTTLPWSAYMTARFHHPILVTSNGGETLSGGLNPVLLEPWSQRRLMTYGRDFWFGPGKWLQPFQNGYLTKAEQTLPYDRQDALLRQRTMDWVKAHPGDALYLELCKVGYMWGVYPLLKNGAGQLLFGNIPTIALLAFSVVCFVRLPGARRPLVRFWILPAFVTLVALISWGSWRFRQPGDAGLIAFSNVCLLMMIAARLPRRAPALS